MAESRKVGRLRREVEKAQLSAVSVVRGLFRKEGEPGYNMDAELPWKEASTRTRAALILTSGTMAAERAKTDTTVQAFGVVMMQGRLESDQQWESMAASVGPPRAIEAMEIKGDSISTKVIHGGVGLEREGAEELRENLREEAEAAQAGKGG